MNITINDDNLKLITLTAITIDVVRRYSILFDEIDEDLGVDVQDENIETGAEIISILKKNTYLCSVFEFDCVGNKLCNNKKTQILV